MAFPTIPTAAATRIIGNVQADTTAMRTGPDLAGLTMASATCLSSSSSATSGAAPAPTMRCFSGWTDGFIEFHDSGTNWTIAIGCAYKWADGTESGTVAVTQARARSPVRPR